MSAKEGGTKLGERDRLRIECLRHSRTNSRFLYFARRANLVETLTYNISRWKSQFLITFLLYMGHPVISKLILLTGRSNPEFFSLALGLRGEYSNWEIKHVFRRLVIFIVIIESYQDLLSILLIMALSLVSLHSFWLYPFNQSQNFFINENEIGKMFRWFFFC